jgi:outer membrane protein TolC
MGNGSGTAVQPSTSMQGNSMSSQTSGTGMADIYRIQIEMGDLENSIALLKNQSQTLAARFNLYLNRPAGMKIYMPDTLKADTLELSLTAITDSMFAYNPMLGMLDYEQQSLEARKKMVTRMGAPMMGLGVNYSLINKSAMSTSSMNGKDMIMPMATVSLPIYRGKYKAMQNEAELLRNASKLNYQATENSLQTEYYQALQLYKDSQRRIKQYENQRLLAKKALDIMLKTFSTSGADLTDILRIRQQAYDYELKQIEAAADQNTAIAWLKRLTAVTRID